MSLNGATSESDLERRLHAEIVRFRRNEDVWRDECGLEYRAKSNVGRVLKALVYQGGQGLTAIDLPNYRLAANVHYLRTRLGLQIITMADKRSGSRIARYVLTTPLTRSSRHVNRAPGPLPTRN